MQLDIKYADESLVIAGKSLNSEDLSPISLQLAISTFDLLRFKDTLPNLPDA